LALFLISGAAGLIYEVTWTRAFGVVFGNTVFAVSTVLSAFMLGLAAGSWLFGRIADRSTKPLRLYALLELAIGVYAFFLPVILAKTDILYVWLFRSYELSFYPLSLVRFALSIVILFIPTALMGGTLPVLSKLWSDPSREEAGQTDIGQSVGLLYAINTFGAVAGSFLAGYVLLRTIGVSNTIYLAASANVFVAVLALILSRFLGYWQPATVGNRAESGPRRQHKLARQAEQDAATQLSRRTERRALVLLAVCLAGFCALALEVLWTRVLVFVLGTSAYAFACMLTCFILGIAIGSFLCSRLFVERLKRPILALGVVQLLVALSVLGSIPLLGVLWHIDHLLTRKALAFGFWKEAAAHFIDTSAVLLVPTVLMGTVFPIAVKICAKSWKAAGRRIGQVYASNTIGCVLGSFAAGFIMVPLLGLRDSLLIIIGIQFFLATVLVLFSERRRILLGLPTAAISVAAVGAAAVSYPRDIFLKTMNTHHYPSEIVYIKDDATGTVTVHDLPDGDRLIAVDGVNVAGVNLMLRTTQKLQGYIPLLAHNNPRSILQIGFGSGETSGVGLAFGVPDYSIVEICPGVFEAGKFFEDINKGSYKDDRLKKIIMDGKNFVKLTDQKFDVIMNDSTYPGTTGSSALYTYDHFKQCREHLNAEGVLSCWLPIDLRPEDFRIVLRSFQAVMPHCCLWMANNCLNKHAVLLGTMSPLSIDFQRVKKMVERPDISSDLAEIKIYSAYDFLDCFVVGENGLRKMTGAGPLNTDDKPSLEFGAAVYRDIEGCWMEVLDSICWNHSPVSAFVVNTGETPEQSQQVRATLQQYFTGTRHALEGMLAILQGDPEIMKEEFDLATKANPLDRDVQNCLDELHAEIETLAEAVERTPANAQLRARLAKRHLLVHNYELGAEEYRQYLQFEPRDAAAWNNLGVCYEGLERFEDALSAFKKAIQYDAGIIPAYLNMARVYEKLGDLPSASRSLEQILPVCPASQRAYVSDRLARTYFMQKKYKLALQILDSALEQVPGDSPARDYLLNRKDFVLRATREAQR
jgi:spermidine synthase